jgi:N-acetylglucosaminyl-diphospho-decaprenol L-rhamnosyltransferase
MQASATPALTVQIVSYNTRDLTLRCLETLLAATAAPMRVVVLDNASDDGSADAVAAAFPQVELIRSPDNLGFARANNVIAGTAATEWLLLLNSDTEVLPGAVDALLAFAVANPAHGIYGGRTLFPDGSLNRGSCYDRLTPWSAFCHATGLVAAFKGSALFDSENIGGWARDSVREVDIVSGCFFLTRTALWRELGGFDARFFMYGEEVDLCHRARARGWRPVVTPAATIVHLGGASRSSPASKRIQVARSRASVVALHWPARWRPWGRAMLWLWAANRYAAASLMARAGVGRAAGARGLWAEVWARRRDWLRGWQARDPASATGAAVRG